MAERNTNMNELEKLKEENSLIAENQKLISLIDDICKANKAFWDAEPKSRDPLIDPFIGFSSEELDAFDDLRFFIEEARIYIVGNKNDKSE